MRDAAEEMRSAANELRREDPSAAAARAERAAEQLRQMEQRLRTGTAAGAQRANGDLRLEAQQLVDAQRRIADEAARLAKGEAGGDAQRRLASDKVSLADRVDALERAARAMSQGSTSQGASSQGASSQGATSQGKTSQGKAAPDDGARAAGETAADLRRQKIGERMRASANDMRDGRGTGRERARGGATDRARARSGCLASGGRHEC